MDYCYGNVHNAPGLFSWKYSNPNVNYYKGAGCKGTPAKTDSLSSECVASSHVFSQAHKHEQSAVETAVAVGAPRRLQAETTGWLAYNFYKGSDTSTKIFHGYGVALGECFAKAGQSYLLQCSAGVSL